MKNEKTNNLLSAMKLFEAGVIDKNQLMEAFYIIREIPKEQQKHKKPIGRPKRFKSELLNDV